MHQALALDNWLCAAYRNNPTSRIRNPNRKPARATSSAPPILVWGNMWLDVPYCKLAGLFGTGLERIIFLAFVTISQRPTVAIDPFFSGPAGSWLVLINCKQNRAKRALIESKTKTEQHLNNISNSAGAGGSGRVAKVCIYFRCSLSDFLAPH